MSDEDDIDDLKQSELNIVTDTNEASTIATDDHDASPTLCHQHCAG